MENQPQQGEKKNGIKIVLIIVIGLLLALNGLLAYLYMTNTREIKDKKQQIQFTTQQLVDAKSKIDSLEVEIQKRIKEFEALGVQNDSLNQALIEVQELKEKFRKDASKAWYMFNERKDKLDGYTELLNQKDDEITKLKAEMETLFVKNKELQEEKVNIEKSIDTLKNKNSELEEKVKLASALLATDIKILAVDSKKKEIVKQPYKSSKIARLKLQFNLAENKVAVVETKAVYFKIIGPDGKMMLSESAGKSAESPDGKVFTDMISVLYRRDNQVVTAYYSKGGDYQSGTYNVEIYCEGGIIGKSSFLVK